MAESKNNDWRELCAAAVKEQDAAKLTCLVNQIIEAIDQTLTRSPTLNASTERRCHSLAGYTTTDCQQDPG
jgi:hypothetical protein